MIHAVEGSLQAYLDDEMAAADRSALESHLLGCAACRKQLAELRRFGSEVRAALAVSDMVAGTATALQQVRMRRDALGGAPAAATGNARRNDAARWTAFGKPLHFTPVSLLKAASVALVVAAAASLAVPGSPLLAWLRDALQGPTVEPVPESAVPTPDPPPAAVQTAMPPAGFIEPMDGTIQIRLTGAAADAEIRVRLTGEGRAGVHPSGDADPRYRTRPGLIEVSGLGSGDVLIELPRSVPRASIEVNGRLYLLKAGDELTLPGPVTERDDGGVTFQTRL
jgi:anti-sigma factor RsiW